MEFLKGVDRHVTTFENIFLKRNQSVGEIFFQKIFLKKLINGLLPLKDLLKEVDRQLAFSKIIILNMFIDDFLGEDFLGENFLGEDLLKEVDGSS